MLDMSAWFIVIHYESCRTFKKVRKTRGAGFTLPGFGVSPITSFFHARRRRAWKRREKEFFGGHSRPRQDAPPPALPVLRTFLKVRHDS